MSLLIELKERRTHVLEELNRVEDLRAELADFDRVIAALEPKAVADEWHEDFLALTDEQPELFEPQEIEAPAQADPPSAELRSVPGAEEEVRDQFEEEAERAAAIELTADVMPESGLHEEAPALNADMQDEREQPYRIIADVDDKPLTIDFETFYEATECMEELKLRSTSNAELSVLHEGENGEQERVTLSSFAEAEPQPDGYAPVTDAWIETTPGTLAEYVPTNPEADERAKLADYYSPENVEKRNRFNPWGGVAHLFGKPKVDA